MNLFISNSKINQGIARFIKKTLTFAPLIVVLALTNYFIDPASLFKSDNYIKEAADILLQSKHVANISNFNARLLQKFYIEGLTEKKDIVAFGSSRSLQINSQLFPNKKFFNNSVTASTLGDYIAIFELYRENNVVPDTVILGVDPWIFNKNNHVQTWKTLDVYYHKFLFDVGLEKKASHLSILQGVNMRIFQMHKYLQLFSLSYFQTSVARLRLLSENIRNGSFQTSYYSTNEVDLDDSIKLSDGSFIYNKEQLLRNSEEVLQIVKAAFILDDYSRQAFSSLDSHLKQTFETFVKFMLEKKVKVVFWLSPYHPYAYNYFVTHNNYSILKEIETYVRELALKNNILVIGSYDPGAFCLSEDDFYDGIHPKREAVKKIFNHYQPSLFN